LQERGSFEILHRAKETAVLSYSRLFLLVPLLLLLAILGSSADTSEQKKPTLKQIAQWVEQLGDNDFKVRENSSKKLWQAGAAAESILEKVVNSDDPEVVRRARELLDKFRWGIYPDTPAEIVALIRAYQSSAGIPRIEVLHKLLDSGDTGLRAVLKIAAAETDANQRDMLGDAIANRLPTSFLLAVTEGKYEYFERLLEFSHEAKFVSHTQFVAYWLLRRKLPERIAHFTTRLNAHPEDKWLAETLVYLHRANGDLIAASTAATKCDRPALLEDILVELGDWRALVGSSDNTRANNTAENWAFRAAFARLAGKQNQFEKAVRELCESSKGKPQEFAAAKGLLLNDRPAEGLDLLRTLPKSRGVLFDILRARLEFGAALGLAEKDEIPPSEDYSNIPSLYLARARLLCFLGDKGGEALFDRYAERIKDEIDPGWVENLLTEEMRAGLRDRAFAHAAKALSIAPPKILRNSAGKSRGSRYFAILFPQHAKTAEVWWVVLRRQFQDEQPAAAMNRLRQLLEGRIAAKEVKTWTDYAVLFVQNTDRWSNSWPRPEAWWPALAEVVLLAGLDDLAFSLSEKSKDPDSLLRLGDLLAAKKQWAKAAERYLKAWEDRVSPGTERGKRTQSQSDGEPFYHSLPLFLAGDALVNAGQKQEGRKLIEQAHRIPFASAVARKDFLNDLSRRGHREAALRETELLLRVSEPNSLDSAPAIRSLANLALSRKDYLKAANGFEQSMLLCLNYNINFIFSAAYVNEPARIHQLRAVGLLAAGKLDEALKHIEIALDYSPGYADLAILFVPELERRGYKKEATDLFNRCYGTFEKLCRDYPRCATAHNEAAWISACCRRNLDRALEHAQKAIELVPTHAGYHDTLAEVYFQRGDKEKSIALQKRAIELDPKRVYFRKQLKRLEVGDRTAERPTEIED
jgi:tetratricopeptide (TPR) repeat protein